MAWGNFVLDKGFDVASAITKYRCVKFTANETVGPTTAITDQIAGVAQFGVTAGEILKGKGSDTRMIGVSEVEAGGAIAVGVRCQLETTGVVTAEVGASGKRIVGICVGTPSTNSGDRIAMLILLGGPLA
jgi:hypothetical protein